MIKKYDKVFLITALTLVFFGFFVLASASLGLAARTDKNSYNTLLNQILKGGGLGLILFLFSSRLYYKKWRTWALPIFLFSFVLMLLVFTPQFGFEHGGATRWLSLGFFSFQPSELLKFAFILYLSSLMSKNQRRIRRFKSGLLPFLITLGIVSVTLILQPDIGTLGVICITGLFLFFIAGGKISHVFFVILLGLLVIFALLYTKPYLMSRINVFLDSSHDLQGEGYQINQVKIAMGSGGIWGSGFGEGVSKFNYLPEPTGDSIFAVVGEEFGFVGTLSLVLLFLFFFYKCLSIGARAPDMFGRLFASGIGILIIVQSFINMFAIVGLMPLTGLPLIFISQGGTALALTFMEIGIVLNISKYN